MTWNTRDVYQRRMDQINGNLDTALSYLKEFCDIYNEKHPQLGKAAETIASLLIMTQEAVSQLKESF